MQKFKKYLIGTLSACCAVLAPVAVTTAQVAPSMLIESHHHLKWYTLSSSHFDVHFQEGNDRTARVVARIAEEVYGPITELYQHEPDTKISIVLKDREDYSNGAAYFMDNKIDIWVPALDSPLRGTNNWLRNVITHEFTHIVQIQASMKRNRRMPAIYLQWMGYENVRRPDVLYGFPNTVISYPLFGLSVPAWFAEGTAQFMRDDLHYDTWDAHRDMILRTRILEGTQLSLDQMGTFANKIAIEREVVYNAGYAFVRYLADRFGEEVLREISVALSRRGVQTITHAIEIATGTNGYVVYDEWIAFLKNEYAAAMRDVTVETNELVEPLGFSNYSPVYSPDGKTAYYLSNRGMDTYRVSLYAKNLADDTIELVHEGNFGDDAHEHTLSCGHSFSFKIRPDASAFSISPDGNQILFSQIRVNRFGESFRDLHLLSLDKKRSVTRITNSARLHEASFSPDGQRIVAVHTEDGTQNLVWVDTESGETSPITAFTTGERVYRPVFSPDANWIYFGYADLGHRSIKRLRVSDGFTETLLESDTTDYRDPFIMADGNTLLYASDEDGIFNIWKQDLSTGKKQRLTSVSGGAFSPYANTDGDIMYSEYRWDGYKIAKIERNHPEKDDAGKYVTPLYAAEQNRATTGVGALNQFDDTAIPHMMPNELAVADSSRYIFADTQMRTDAQDLTMKRYDDVFTSFSIHPVIRFDNYSKLNGSNNALIKAGKWGKLGDNLIRDAKIGMYMSSRDVTDKFNIMGSVLIGPGSTPSDGAGDFFSPSRLVNLDRDMSLQIDYNGLPFIKNRWSPTASIQITNLRRNVKNGLTIEEFPCISCLPDTSHADIAYDIFEAALTLRSKLNRFSYLEGGIAYSPYKVSTSSFYSKEHQAEVRGSSSRYFIGNRLTAAYVYRLDLPWQHGDIAPVGVRGWVRYNYEPSKLLDSYSISNGSLSPEYKTFQNHNIEWFSRVGFFVGKQHLQWNVRGYAQLAAPDDDFFMDYYGGLTGMRSYPFFSLGGYQTLYSTVSWSIPLWKRFDYQMNRFTFDKIFMRLFAETGKGWGNPLTDNERMKSGVGAELRLGLNSNYLIANSLFISGAYGFNQFDVNLPSQFITPDGTNKVRYGREVLLHIGLLFDFEL